MDLQKSTVRSPTETPRFLPRRRRIFVNRDLKIDSINFIGFDMDYTLARYDQSAMTKLSLAKAIDNLIETKRYSHEIRSLEYHEDFVFRGLMVDKRHGNIFKTDAHKHVGRVFHGYQELPKTQRRRLYRKDVYSFDTERFYWIDTLFALPEALLYAGIIEYYESRGTRCDYETLFDDIRDAVDTCHRDDSLKGDIKRDLSSFLERDPDLPATLHKLRSSGKKLFLLTNSHFEYTHAVMTYLLSGQKDDYATWSQYFDFVLVGANKPDFFANDARFLELTDAGEARGSKRIERFERGRIYQGGNISDLEKFIGGRGDEILYVGDHIYGDMIRSKKSTRWRTAMVIPELEQELALRCQLKAEVEERIEVEQQLDRVDSEINYQNALLKSLRNVDSDVASKAIDAVARDVIKKNCRSQLILLRGQRRGALQRIKELDRAIVNYVNPNWGWLFKEGNENSGFGAQVEIYACLYTSRVSNFLHYSPLQHFRSPRHFMPHEKM